MGYHFRDKMLKKAKVITLLKTENSNYLQDSIRMNIYLWSVLFKGWCLNMYGFSTVWCLLQAIWALGTTDLWMNNWNPW